MGQKIFDQVAIVGVGLIGGSLGMAIIKNHLAREVIGIDVDESNLELAQENAAIHHGTTDLEEGVTGAELVIVATPVGLTLEIISKIISMVPEGCIITDVGSTKAEITARAEALIPPDKYFIGGHPMAGSEISGVRGADPYLFENAVYILTPSEKTNADALDKLKVLLKAIGARVFEISPQEHDVMVAAVSHLPHLVAAALVNTVGRLHDENSQLLLLAAGGFRDTTRIAAGQPLMWRDICLTNKDKILEVLKEFKKALARLEKEIAVCNGAGLEKEFENARKIRALIPAKMKGYLPLLYELVITIPDKPGMIAMVSTILGNAGININDIEILRVREGEGGTIRLGFGSESDQEKALEILRKEGISARRR